MHHNHHHHHQRNQQPRAVAPKTAPRYVFLTGAVDFLGPNDSDRRFFIVYTPPKKGAR